MSTIEVSSLSAICSPFDDRAEFSSMQTFAPSNIDHAMQPLYDAIGVTYAATRHADPAMAQAHAEYVDAKNGGSFLDLACETGNYTCALEMLGGRWQ